MKKTILYLAAIATLCGSLSSCKEEAETFNNKAYITSNELTTILIKGDLDDKVMNIESGIAQPVNFDITLNYAVNSALVEKYNKAYYDNAQLLPEANYKLNETSAKILAGSVKATNASITFSNLADLDRNIVYVLPVEANCADMEMLSSKKVSYYVVKGAALVNCAANLSHNYLKLTAPAPALGSMSQVTVECTVKVDEFGKLISTICGIEGKFLIRIGDAGIPDDQIQLATSNGNVSDAAWKVPIGEWVHIALTYDSSDGATNVYFNGVKKGNTQMHQYKAPVNWNAYDSSQGDLFFVGKSYNDDRWLEGDMCELRVWNRILSVEELNERNHAYFVPVSSEGLVAYWKFDDGAGNVITDHVNGYNITANKALTWHEVELPAK